jgi:hypothetical protein
MPGSNILGQCASCCAPADGITFTCVSKFGSGNLRGWSKFTNPNTGDWNLRKFTRKYQSGTRSVCLDELYTYARERMYFVAGGYSLWNVATNAKTNANIANTGHKWDGGGSDPACGVDPSSWDVDYSSYPYEVQADSTTHSCAADPDTDPADIIRVYPTDSVILNQLGSGRYCTGWGAITDNELTRAFSGGSGGVSHNDCDDCGGANEWGLSITSSLVLTLDAPDTVFAALARGSPTTGTHCRTLKGSIGGSDSFETVQISVTGTRAVQATLHLPIATAGTYTFTVDLQPYTPGTETALTVEEEVVTIEVESGDIVGGFVDYVYDVPVRTDADIEITGVRDLAEV